jgi:hypothetical protein
VTVVERDGTRLAVVNLSGSVFLDAARSPFDEAEAILGSLEGKADHILVDFHAEATSEKVAMGWYLDGRVTAVLGTHTHVPTADDRVLPGGTAYMSDVGMTGPRGGRHRRSRRSRRSPSSSSRCASASTRPRTTPGSWERWFGRRDRCGRMRSRRFGGRGTARGQQGSMTSGKNHTTYR